MPANNLVDNIAAIQRPNGEVLGGFMVIDDAKSAIQKLRFFSNNLDPLALSPMTHQTPWHLAFPGIFLSSTIWLFWGLLWMLLLKEP